MEVFEAEPRAWGNSLGITIPKEIVEKEGIAPHRKVRFLILSDRMKDLRKAFGTMKFRKPTQRIMREIDQGYD